MSRLINVIILHCSDSDQKAHDNPETIEEWHLARGFKRIAYHFIITQDGIVHKGREESEIGAHVKGHNSTSIGICLTGRHKFTAKQFLSLELLCKSLCEKYDLAKTDILPHNAFDPRKTCPNFDVHSLIASWSWH